MRSRLKYSLLFVFCFFVLVELEADVVLSPCASINYAEVVLKNGNHPTGNDLLLWSIADLEISIHGEKVETIVIPQLSTNDSAIRLLKHLSSSFFIQKRKTCSLITFTNIFISRALNKSPLSDILRI